MELKLYTKAFFLSFLFLFSCTKSEAPLDDPNVPVIGNLPELGTLSFKYNGVKYQDFVIFSSLNPEGRLDFVITKSFYPQFPIDESIFFLEIPFELGEYNLGYSYQAPPYGFISILYDGDAIKTWYHVDTIQTTNIFELKKIDTIAKTISGTFEAKFLVEVPGSTWDNWPDTIDITEGEFYLEYK